jgi:large subunit ribosomal protein L9
LHALCFHLLLTKALLCWLRCSVTKQDITDAIYQQMGQDITKYELEIPEIKTLGTFQCTLKVHPEVTGVFSVVIQKEKNVQAKKR